MSNEPGAGSRSAQLAQLAAKAAQIARAAAAGGLHGAVIETAKQFLPQLLKITAILLILFLLLPMLIFNAIPHFLFGWMGNDSGDIKEMTDKAASMASYYDQFDDISQKETDKLIEQLSEGYDTVEVDSDVRNTSLSWFVAITSVYYQQDLGVIDENAIHTMMADKLTYTSEVDKNNSLKLSIEDLQPFDLMDKLEFDEGQRNWATLLFSSMTDYQYVDIGNADYDESYGTDYGHITYTDGATEVVYFNQADSRWADIKYGSSGTIGKAGCGPTALAIVVSSLTNKTVTPKQMAVWSYKNGYRVENSGSKHALIPDGAKHFGLKVEGASRKDGQKIVDALASGKLVVAIMSKGAFTNGGHFIVLRGVTEDGKIQVADPVSVKRSDQLWDLGLILNEARRDAGASGPFWIISI